MKNILILAIAMSGASMPLDALAENRVDRIRPDAPELAHYGDYPVGVATTQFTNPGQIDVLNSTDEAQPTYDRTLTTEIWYPAAEGTQPGGIYSGLLRDGETVIELHGQAARDAEPAAGETFPLVVISHGWPGDRYLMSHLAENIASKGYVVIAPDHLRSGYQDTDFFKFFGSTLYHRPLDQRFLVEAMAELDGPIGDITDVDNAAVVGYSMGGYGALIFGGAGITEDGVNFRAAPPARLLDRHVAGSQTHEELPDDRVKAIVTFGPWGRNRDFWDAQTMAGFDKPLMMLVGDADDISGYDALRQIFDEATGTNRHMLVFEGANHNAAAPIPAPIESWQPSDKVAFTPFFHYGDAVWDTNRMNNITQHFVTAFLDLHLKGDEAKAAYLDLIPRAADGVVSLNDDGTPKDDHTYWTGFAPRTALGLTFETLEEGEGN
ncbi:alpha/beta hydrolase family protein [Ruegeria jejuensis]|uniref:alpha/beta hydrolase family protein n=1 Tax=Ruegeria jejuensis TaxID=3233338 RepID=UPI00355B96E8